ncbi:gamma-glutamylcyclotransferase family protein [Sphingomonas sp. IC081]|uniref:gamma-glutamylcyclotransferase family protein n=1 Tax=Sphingomonas sp. IC081 TaxID=304378 RepID=UPI0021AF9AFD|nr:gamma-glutamylcyclotransferase family protein [Sphingomonas sp. IC081]
MAQDLFVYGTLQPHAGTRMGEWIAARMAHAEPAWAPGRIFAVKGGNGWFPALLPARSGAGVRGTLCRLDLRPGDLARLDRYEGREYRRICLPVRLASGRRAPAQIYVWRAPQPKAAPVIRDGDYLGWLARTGRRPFTTLRNGT